MLRGSDYWRTVLDGACGIDVYGNNGVAAGDFDNDGFDDLYVCQPSGLPNRLYRNRGDGTLEDVTEKAGVGVLDNTACALFADFENKGLQDLLVVCGSGPLLFLNQGDGTFSIKRDAFKFEQSSPGNVHPCGSRRLRSRRTSRYLLLPVQLLPGPGPVSLSGALFRCPEWSTKFSAAQRRKCDVCRQDRSGRIECGERPL